MYARTIIATIVPGKADEAVRIFTEQVAPEVRKQPGFVSTSIYIDRDSNQAQTVSVWETKEAMQATHQGSEYLAKVVGMLRGCIVNKEYGTWEVAYHDQA